MKDALDEFIPSPGERFRLRNWATDRTHRLMRELRVNNGDAIYYALLEAVQYGEFRERERAAPTTPPTPEPRR
jgi:hypothetical protein